MTDFPKAEVILIKHRWGNQWMILCCPYCGKRHWHGAGEKNQDPRQFLSHRVQHCAIDGPDFRGYILVEKKEAL